MTAAGMLIARTYQLCLLGLSTRYGSLGGFGHPFSCTLNTAKRRGEVWIDKIEGLSLEILLERDIELLGTSGSPILNADGAAVALVASQYPGERRSGPCPHLVAALPAALAPSR
jgi:hypothetical protein